MIQRPSPQNLMSSWFSRARSGSGKPLFLHFLPFLIRHVPSFILSADTERTCRLKKKKKVFTGSYDRYKKTKHVAKQINLLKLESYTNFANLSFEHEFPAFKPLTHQTKMVVAENPVAGICRPPGFNRTAF